MMETGQYVFSTPKHRPRIEMQDMSSTRKRVVVKRTVGQCTFTEIETTHCGVRECFEFEIDKNIGNHYRSVICGRPTRCFLGPNYAFFLLALTLALLIGSATLMYLGRCVNVIAYFVQFIFFCAFIMSYLLVAFTDPGIIPKQTREQLLMELSQLEEEGVDLSHRKVCTDGCNIIRPPYTYHCASCDACIVGIDHHCPWTGHCIGENNKFFFTAFMWSMVPSLLGAIGTMLLYLYRASTGRGTCPSVEFSHTSYI